jgi:2-polyprenyl-6-methoxyphenol hydroxylase-like FAD-dependent oxidoreductase
MTRAPRIAIVGGGVGGLAAVLALERWGAEIVVCEQSPAPISVGSTPGGRKKEREITAISRRICEGPGIKNQIFKFRETARRQAEIHSGGSKVLLR